MYVCIYVQGGVLVGVVHGCKGPELERLLKDRLEHEHKVLNGEAERTAVRFKDQQLFALTYNFH